MQLQQHQMKKMAAVTNVRMRYQVQSAFPLDVVVGEGAAIVQLLAREDEALHIGGDALLVLDLVLEGADGVAGLHFEGDSFAGQDLHKHLHAAAQAQH